jgi:hypothetical protein
MDACARCMLVSGIAIVVLVTGPAAARVWVFGDSSFDSGWYKMSPRAYVACSETSPSQKGRRVAPNKDRRHDARQSVLRRSRAWGHEHMATVAADSLGPLRATSGHSRRCSNLGVAVISAASAASCTTRPAVGAKTEAHRRPGQLQASGSER